MRLCPQPSGHRRNPRADKNFQNLRTTRLSILTASLLQLKTVPLPSASLTVLFIYLFIIIVIIIIILANT